MQNTGGQDTGDGSLCCVYNLQGDVIAIIDQNGDIVVEYTYDVWGKLISVTGSMADTIGQQNPIRYRGYYYDTETGFYHLKSRYYDPVIGRFLNADAQLNTSSGVLGYNLFAYCINNPASKVDYTGNKPGDLFDTIDEAARDFALCYNSASINDNVEYAASFYSVKTTVKSYQTVTKKHRFLWWTWTTTSTETIKTIKIQYSYTTVKKGNGDSVKIPSVPLFKKRVAAIHTHAAYDSRYANDVFSDSDKACAISLKVPLYVATPLGTLRKYNPNDDTDILIFDDIPFDPNHPDK